MDGRLVTTSYDGDVRLYNSRFERIAKTKAPGGQRPSFARFSPDGKQIAVGFSDSTAVNVLSGEDLSLLYTPDTNDVHKGNMDKIEWSRDGRQLYAAGDYEDGSNRRPVRIWEKGGRGSYRDVPLSDNTVFRPEGTLGRRACFWNRRSRDRGVIGVIGIRYRALGGAPSECRLSRYGSKFSGL